MNLLGTFLVGEGVIYRVQWTPQVGDTVTATDLTLRHEVTGEVLGPLPMTADGPNAFKRTVALDTAGRWEVKWSTTPLGGAAEDVVYIEP